MGFGKPHHKLVAVHSQDKRCECAHVLVTCSAVEGDDTCVERTQYWFKGPHPPTQRRWGLGNLTINWWPCIPKIKDVSVHMKTYENMMKHVIDGKKDQTQ